MNRRSRRPYAGADERTREAKARGYPARSVFKLEEIDRRCRLFRSGQSVLDLGAAPGSWSLYASQRVGQRGRVLALDLSPIEVELPVNVRAVRGDAFESHTEIDEASPFQVVVSDMAPRTSGSRSTDQALSHELCQRALVVAERVLAPGGSFVTKLFMSQALAELKRSVGRLFESCRIIRPAATRTQSTEVFVVGLGRHPPSPEG